MTKFADQLVDDLVREHGARLAAPAAPAPKRRLVTHLLLVATGAAGVAAAVARVLATGGGTPPTP